LAATAHRGTHLETVLRLGTWTRPIASSVHVATADRPAIESACDLKRSTKMSAFDRWLLVQKLYADMVTDDGAVCIAYRVNSRCCGFEETRAGLELYHTGQREVLHACNSHVSIAGNLNRPLPRVEFDLPGGGFVLEFQSSDGAWKPGFPIGADGLSWDVRVCRGAAIGRWSQELGRSPMRGFGYVDFVRLKRLPWMLRLARLDWGRIHGESSACVFNVVQLRNGARWGRYSYWSDGEQREEGPVVAIQYADASLRISLPNKEIDLAPLRVLHDGPAVDPERFPNPVRRHLTRLVMGPIREKRWLSRPAVPTGTSSENAYAIHESVVFGSRFARAPRPTSIPPVAATETG
jgi:hypothetical protein